RLLPGVSARPGGRGRDAPTDRSLRPPPRLAHPSTLLRGPRPLQPPPAAGEDALHRRRAPEPSRRALHRRPGALPHLHAPQLLAGLAANDQRLVLVARA